MFCSFVSGFALFRLSLGPNSPLFDSYASSHFAPPSLPDSFTILPHSPLTPLSIFTLCFLLYVGGYFFICMLFKRAYARSESWALEDPHFSLDWFLNTVPL